MPARRVSDDLTPEAVFAPLADYRTIGLAVSGGPDSLALMLLAAGYAKAHPDSVRFFVYSVDHGLRPEAADEVALVVAEAGRLGLPARGLRWTGRKPKTGIQEAARNARYTLLFDALRRDGGDVLATAHHIEDQAETVLMRLAHGSGLAGVRGMLPLQRVGDGYLARPLLEVSRDSLRALVAKAGLTPVADPSNDDDHYERVRWRQAMPAFAALGIDARRLALFASRAADAHEAIASAAAAADTRIVAYEHEGGANRAAHIDRKRFGRLSPAVAVELLGRVMSSVGEADKSRDLGAIEALYRALASGDPLPRRTLHRCLISAGADSIRIEREPLKGARARRSGPTKP